MRVAFLFDNDGVLIDSSELHWRSWELFMEEEPSFRMDKQQFIDSFGKRNDLILQDLVPEISKEERKNWAERKETLFREIARTQVQLLPGMESFLKKVQKANIPRIIASSTPTENLKMFLSSTVLGNYFDQALSAETVPHGKPAPDVFIKAAQILGYDPNESIVFEDAPAGIAAGKAAGAFVVALATTHNEKQLSNYDLIYPSASALDLNEILTAFEVWSR